MIQIRYQRCSRGLNVRDQGQECTRPRIKGTIIPNDKSPQKKIVLQKKARKISQIFRKVLRVLQYKLGLG